MTGYIYVALTLVLTCAGQLLMKWQMNRVGPFPAEFGAKLLSLFLLCFQPAAALSLICAYLGALSWMAALAKLPLSTAYPVMSLSYVAVMLGSAVLFDESISIGKLVGAALIICGVWIGVKS